MVSVLYSEDDLHAYGGFNPCVCVWREVSASAYQHRATSCSIHVLCTMLRDFRKTILDRFRMPGLSYSVDAGYKKARIFGLHLLHISRPADLAAWNTELRIFGI